MEDEKWQEKFAEGGEQEKHDREGYTPFNSENREGASRPMRERHFRPRGQRAERAYSADGATGTQEGRPQPSDYAHPYHHRYGDGEHGPYRP